ncbi:hypothetical protein K435DRAFT_855997 [Dendrothele bispora CBS 962.96]|uniref:Zn(2)-C6 fungal-type domain-containing protein n=1 Tax=Dendrothele bispora (strain CBS 962.96) TaxID=1314807 RepID=A0A4V4HGJ8_DENBC|nr:hypothetical protein K435DRAFT_855997 [Dendrothele bispora CBS 962.96]
MSGSTSQRMPRGGACSNCRHRRIKCDGAFPRCSNCEHSTGRFRDCEYPGRGVSQIEHLEEQILELESRNQEREAPIATNTGGNTFLHDPYLAPTVTQAQSIQTSFRVPSTRVSEEVPLQLRQDLLSAFIPYANDIGFFLDLTEISAAILSISPQGSGAPPVTPALMHLIFLWGSRLSCQITFLELEFLSRATKSVPHILSHTTSTTPGTPGISGASNHPDWKVLEAIQSHVLLAQYFFHTGRKLEGKYSVNIATSLVLGTRMHRIRSEEVTSGQSEIQMALGRVGYPDGISLASSQTLQTHLQGEKEAQCINAFWTVLSLNSCWAAVEGHGSSLPYWTPEMRVDTPWPQVNLNPATRSGYTIQRFLSNCPDDAHSTLALYAKACILLEQAFELTSRYERNRSSPNPNHTSFVQKFLRVFNNLTSLTIQFTFRLPSISSIQNSVPYTQIPDSGSEKRGLLVIHTLARVTIIWLYTLSENSLGSDERVNTHRLKVEAANEAAKMIELVDVVFIDSIMAMLWPIVNYVLTTEIHRLGQSGAGQQDPLLYDYQKSVDLITKAMSGIAPSSPLMDKKLKKMQELSRSG